MIDTLDNDVGLNTSCVYTHTFADKSVYVGAAKTLGKRDQDLTSRNDTYAEKLRLYGNPEVAIINTFDTTDGDYAEVASHEREVYDLLVSMDVEMVNEQAPTGVPNPWWTDHPIYKMIEEGRHPSTIAIKNGTHNFLTDNPSVRRIEDGTHNFLTDNPIYKMTEEGRNPSTIAIKNGTHNFLTDNPNVRRVADGTHHFLTGDQNRDFSVYTFECFKGPDTGATFTGMRSDLLKAYPYINTGNMNTHIRGVGYPNGANGWRLVKE